MSDDLDAMLARLDEANRKSADNLGWFTTGQAAIRWGISDTYARQKIHRLHAAGRLECQRRPHRRIDGVTQVYPMYRLK